MSKKRNATKGTARSKKVSAKDLPVKSGGAVKGGESVTFVYGKLGVQYTQQNANGSQSAP